MVELLGRLANESFGMYREALIWEMEKCGMAMLPKTRCLEITPTGVKVENAGGVQTLEADTVLFAPVSYTHLDVYKRQILARYSRGSLVEKPFTE